MKAKKVLAALLAVTVVMGLNGCSSGLQGAADAEAPKQQDERQTADAAQTEESKKDDEEVTLTLSVDSDETLDGLQAVCDKAKEVLGITVELDIYTAGTDGDNIMKTRLASGDMADMCVWSDSKFKSVGPDKYFMDLSGTDIPDKLDDTYREAVTYNGGVYGIPVGTSMCGAILYNRDLYEKYNLEVPKTWDEFLKNCQVIKDGGDTAVLGTFADSWTAQVLFLGDYYNVSAKDPDFYKNFEAGTAKYANTPAAMRSFQKFEDLKDYYNSDYMATIYDDGCEILAEGNAAHWIMLTQALSNIYSLYDKETVDKIGVFGIPDEDPDNQGITVWTPSTIFGNKNSDKTDDILRFMEFYISEQGLDAYCSAQMADGPFLVKGYESASDGYRAVEEDMQAYFDAGKTEVDMQSQVQVVGSDLPAICVEVATGQIDGKAAAEKYDADCYKAAVQLNLDWKE